MNPYPDRIAELHNWLEARYGQRDRQATEVLLSQLLSRDVSRTRSPWIVLETDYPNRDTADAWFSFGGEYKPQPRSLATARVCRAQRCEAILLNWLAERRTGTPALFVEAEWRRLPASGHGAKLMMVTHSYGALLAQCIRLRCAHPKGDHAVRMEREQDAQELARLTRRVLYNDYRNDTAALAATMQNPAPGSLFYWCELVQKAAPLQGDWETLTGGLATIARNIALLYNDGRKPDWRAAERTMRDTIPYAVEWLLGQTSLDRKRGIQAFRLFRESGYGLDAPLTREIRRLNRDGVLLARRNMQATDSYRYHPWKYRLGSKDWHDLVDRTKEILV